MLIAKPFIEHDSEPDLATPHPHNQFPLYILMLIPCPWTFK